MAVTAHWVAQSPKTTTFQLKAALIAFHHLPESHTGENIAENLLLLIDRANISQKVSSLHKLENKTQRLALARIFHP